MIEELKAALESNAASVQGTYWACVEELAEGEQTKQVRDATMKRIAKACEALRIGADQAEADVAMIRELLAVDAIAATLPDAQIASRQLIGEAAGLEADAAAAMARAADLNKQAQDLRHRAGAATNGPNNATQKAQAIRKKLEGRGHPGAVAAAAGAKIRQQVAQARGDLERARAELEAAASAHASVLKDTQRRTGGGPPNTAGHVDRCQRDVLQAAKRLHALEARIEEPVA